MISSIASGAVNSLALDSGRAAGALAPGGEESAPVGKLRVRWREAAGGQPPLLGAEDRPPVPHRREVRPPPGRGPVQPEVSPGEGAGPVGQGTERQRPEDARQA